MKKINSVIITISIMAMIGIASATGIDTISIGGDTQGLNGQTKSVTVDVSGMSAIGALQLDVIYDPAVITLNSVTFGSVASGGLAASNINNTTGKATIGIISATGISGTGNLATIFFTVAGNAGASTNVQIIKKNLKDFNVLPVNTEPIITGGTFTVIGQSSPPHGTESTPIILTTAGMPDLTPKKNDINVTGTLTETITVTIAKQTIAAPIETTKEIPIATTKNKSPGFGIMISIGIIVTIYILRRMK